MSQQIVVVNKAAALAALANIGIVPQAGIKAFIPLTPDQVIGLMQALDPLMEIMERDYVEKDTTWWQPIPYGVIVDDRWRIVSYRRPDKQRGEERLRGQRSVGFGGHVDGCELIDAETGITRNAMDVLQGCLERELDEELVTNFIPLAVDSCKGLIVDETNEVGKVHLGLVYLVMGATSALRAKSEDEVCELTTIPPSIYSITNGDNSEYENWSQLVLENTDYIIGPVSGF